MFSKWLMEDAWHENLFAEVILKKLCERHLTSLYHANLQCINLRIEIIFSQNLCILMVKTDVKDKFSHFLAVYMAATLRILGQVHAHAVCFLLLPPPDNTLADLGGVRDAHPPLGVQILSISCSFRENLACSRPPWRVHAPLGKILDPPL